MTQGGQDFPLLLKRTDPAEDSAPAASSYTFASDKELQGFWNGTLDAGGTKLRLMLKIARITNDTYTATMDSLDQGSKDIPATTVTFNDADVRVEWAALRALFHGKLENGKLVGFWQQGPADFPIEFAPTAFLPAFQRGTSALPRQITAEHCWWNVRATTCRRFSIPTATRETAAPVANHHPPARQRRAARAGAVSAKRNGARASASPRIR